MQKRAGQRTGLRGSGSIRIVARGSPFRQNGSVSIRLIKGFFLFFWQFFLFFFFSVFLFLRERDSQLSLSRAISGRLCRRLRRRMPLSAGRFPVKFLHRLAALDLLFHDLGLVFLESTPRFVNLSF